MAHKSTERARCPRCGRCHTIEVTEDWTDGVVRCCGFYGILRYTSDGEIRHEGYPFDRIDPAPSSATPGASDDPR